MLAAPTESLESLTLDMPWEVSSANTGGVPKATLTAPPLSSGADVVVRATPRRTAGTHFAAEESKRANKHWRRSTSTVTQPSQTFATLLLCRQKNDPRSGERRYASQLVHLKIFTYLTVPHAASGEQEQTFDRIGYRAAGQSGPACVWQGQGLFRGVWWMMCRRAVR